MTGELTMQSTRMRRSRAFCAHLGALLVIFMISGVAHAAQAPATPEQAPATPAADPASSATKDYLIGPGDALQIFVWQHTDLSVTVPVRPDGKISTPLVEDLVAVGKTPSQLARDIETVLQEFTCARRR